MLKVSLYSLYKYYKNGIFGFTVFGSVGIFWPYGKNIISANWFRPHGPAQLVCKWI